LAFALLCSAVQRAAANAVMDADTKRQFKELRPAVFALASPPAKEQ
jgi:hypothetical protein